MKQHIKFRKIWRLAGSGGTKTASFTNPQKNTRMGSNPGTGVATALTRHLLFLCVLFTFVVRLNCDIRGTGCGHGTMAYEAGRGSTTVTGEFISEISQLGFLILIV